MTETELKTLLTSITPPDEAARAAAHVHWMGLAKPLGGLGALETMLEDAAALTGSADLDFSRRVVAVLCAGGHDVDARRVDAAVTENICQFCNILLHTIESPGKEFPQIVGKHLVRIYVCLRTQPLHGRPDIAAVHRLAGPGTEDMPAFDSRAAHIL